MLINVIEDDETIMIPWTQSSYIKKGENSNELRVVCRDSNIELYVNNHYLETASRELKPSSTGNRFGLIIIGDNGTHITFDNIEMWVVEEEEEIVEDVGSSEETTAQTSQGPSKATYLSNINNIINEYDMAINHMNVYHEKIEFSDLDSFIEFQITFLNKIGEINGMLQNITPASGYEGAQAHFKDLANIMYSQWQMSITYLEQENIDAAENMIDEFNKTWREFVDYYDSL